MPAPNKKTRKKTRKTLPVLYADATCTMPAVITPQLFAYKKEMLDFIARASEGMMVRTSDGIEMFLKI